VSAAPTLSCAELTLVDFRNHAETSLAPDPPPVCLFGPNGAGKTNLIEALTMLAPGRGLRGAGLGEIARGGEDGARLRARGWTVSARMRVGGDEVRVGVGAERGPDGTLKRVSRLDGRAASASEIARLVRMIWVTPAMDRLFAGPPGDRRRFLDRLVLGRAAEHGAAAAAYERAVRERQRLLGEDRRDEAWLAALEREMAAHGAALAAARVETVALLEAAIARRPEGAFPKAAIALEGEIEAGFSHARASLDIEDDFLLELKRNRARDAAAGRATFGPHRSDLKVRHGPKDMPAELCSTGEQKALLLGIVLAQAHALAEEPGAGPALMLLDEAAAHLDADRRAALFDELLALPGQAWLTGTDESLFEAFGDRAQRFEVRDGRAVRRD
jgi:DNA replication and repair protein RecF